MTNALLQPVIIMAAWTFLVMLWMFQRRIPAMNEAKIDVQDAMHTSDVAGKLPSHVRAVGDNYNHLHEQPTIFYAVALLIAAAGHADGLFVQLAWGFVALRVVHSLIQNTYNNVMHRFGVFILSWLVLGVMIFREVMNLF
ncbi:MAG: MAPEG family protein [Parvibaculales bacterium]